MDKTHSELMLEKTQWYANQNESKKLADACTLDPEVFISSFDYSRSLGPQGTLRSSTTIEIALREFRNNPKLGVLDLMELPFFKWMLKHAHEQQKWSEGAALPKQFTAKFDTIVYDTVRHATELGCVAAHLASGMHVYEVSEGLIERLKLTSTDDLTIDDVKFPYPTTWFQFPRGAIRTVGLDMALLDVVGCMVREVVRTNSKARMLELTVIAALAFQKDSPSFVLYNVEIPLHLKWDALLASMEMYTLRRSQTQEAFESFESFVPALWDLLINLLMYATHPDAASILEVWNPDYTRLKEQVQKHPKGSHKRERAKEQLRLTAPRHRIILGRGVTPLPPPPPQEKGAPLAVRTLVQGHWQRFATGKGRVDRTWKFRSPFWRGPEGAPESNARHVMV